MEVIIVFLMFVPQVIHYILYGIAEKIFKKTAAARIYTVCLILTTVILLLLHVWVWEVSLADLEKLEDEEPYDVLSIWMFDVTLWIVWAVPYIGLLIACIVNNVRYRKQLEEEYEADAYCDDASEEVEA